MITRGDQDDVEPLAIVGGVRTPLAKAFGPLARQSADSLGRIVVQALLEQTCQEPADVDEVIFGNVAGPPEASNVARVIALRAGIPHDRIAHTVNRNCASGMESAISAWQAIREGRAERIVAGGTESMSNIPLLWNGSLKDLLVAWRRERHLLGRMKLLARLRPSYLKPVAALKLGLTDVTCGLNMGQTAELLAREFSISTEEQNQFALTSHQRAVAAWDRGFFNSEVLPLSAEQTGTVAIARDTGPRPDQSLEALARLRPLLPADGGTITAGNSCPITDGAASMLVMSPHRATELGFKPLGYIRRYALAGCDPRRMGFGPVFATSRLLRQAGLALSDFDLIEINEAFAAQVLACLKAMASDTFARDELQLDRALGELDPQRLNVNGGAIALGHPVGMSGTRLIITLLRALHEKGLQNGLATLCVGGGQGAAVWVQTDLD